MQEHEKLFEAYKEDLYKKTISNEKVGGQMRAFVANHLRQNLDGPIPVGIETVFQKLTRRIVDVIVDSGIQAPGIKDPKFKQTLADAAEAALFTSESTLSDQKSDLRVAFIKTIGADKEKAGLLIRRFDLSFMSFVSVAGQVAVMNIHNLNPDLITPTHSEHLETLSMTGAKTIEMDSPTASVDETVRKVLEPDDDEMLN